MLPHTRKAQRMRRAFVQKNSRPYLTIAAVEARIVAIIAANTISSSGHHVSIHDSVSCDELIGTSSSSLFKS